MNSLLKRQIAKFLEKDSANVDLLLKAVDQTYTNYESQLSMLQRAMKISSDELYEANQKLRNEAVTLKEINNNLEFILNSMNLNSATDENFNTSEYLKQQTAEIVKINKQREELLHNLEKQNEALNEYAHIVSHDLKSPLRSIHSLITWIKEDNDNVFDEKTSKYFVLVQEKVEKMDRLIQGVLTYSKINNSDVVKESIDLNIKLKNILSVIFIPSHIQIKINNKLPTIKADRFRMFQLFQNLISNAINYNDKPDGIVEIASHEYKDHYVFSIKDNGVGIEKKNQEKIFQMFQSFNVDRKTTGIGLSIVRRILENENEKIWIESQNNVGTTFYFTLKKK